MSDVRRYLPDVAAGTVVLALGLAELGWALFLTDQVLAMVVTAIAVGLCRRAPAVAVTLAWLLALWQVTAGVPVLIAQVTVVAVAFGAARWGRPATVWASGVSLPLATLAAILLLRVGGLDFSYRPVSWWHVVRPALGSNWPLAVAVIAEFLLGVPWLLGLLLRASDRARVATEAAAADVGRAHRERQQAEEIARMREDQARLARDVHDVVGHSLAVILSQAQSGQYLPDDDPARLKATLATIAESARTSLREVRGVLSETRPPASVSTDDLDGLIAGVVSSGHDVRSHVVGRTRPLPPEQAVTAYRVLQEMLTNAVRHGRRDAPITVRRKWLPQAELVIEVLNDVDPDVTSGEAGRGLEGMRQRVEAVGGHLELRREPARFVVSAWIPVGA